MDIHCKLTYESAHRLPNVPDGHKCGRMHGHSYRLKITVRGDVDLFTGWVVDFAHIKAVASIHHGRFDHHCLNDFIDNPTVENQLIEWWELLSADGLALYSLTLSETGTCSATYYGPNRG